MIDIFKIERAFLEFFDRDDQSEFKAQFWRLLEDKYQLKRTELITGAKLLQDNLLAQFTSDLAKLQSGEVLQHLVGFEWFAGKTFKVGPEVLIPRPETEELLHIIRRRLPNAPRIIDLATGSGCIAISLKTDSNEVFALEKSSEALKIARENAQEWNVSIHFIEDDILMPEKDWPQSMDLIVSNPPYVRVLEREQMDKRVYDKEPAMALFVSDEDPLIFYRLISDYAKAALNEGGVMALEINQYLSEETVSLIGLNFKSVELIHDQFGNPRFIWAKK